MNDLKKIHSSVGKTTSQLGPIMTWGWQFALTLGALAWIGHWLDEKFDTNVLFILIGIFMGLFGGFYRLFRIIAELPKPEKKTKNKP